jgi:hypothetical protein
MADPKVGTGKSSPFLNNELGLQEKLSKLPLQRKQKNN